MVYNTNLSPDGNVEAELWGATQWLSGNSPEKENNSYEQTGTITSPGNGWISTDDAIFPGASNPHMQTLNMLQQVRQQKHQIRPVGFAQDWSLMVQQKRITTPFLDRNVERIIRTWVPTDKQANSAAWLPEDLWLNKRDISEALSVMAPHLERLSMSGDTSELAMTITQRVNEAQAKYQQLSSLWKMREASEALWELKIAITEGANSVANKLYNKSMNDIIWEDAERDMSFLYSIRSKWQEFFNYYASDGKQLNDYVSTVIKPQVTITTQKAESLPSRQAKTSLVNNDRYRRMAESIYKNNPMAMKQLLMDSKKPEITKRETEFLKAIQPQIDRLYEKRNAYSERYWWDAAQSAFKPYEDLMWLSRIRNKTMMDDIMGAMSKNAASTSSFRFLNF